MRSLIWFSGMFLMISMFVVTPVNAFQSSRDKSAIVIQGAPYRTHLSIQAPFTVANQYDLLVCDPGETAPNCQYLDLSWRPWIGHPGWYITNNSVDITANDYEYEMYPRLLFQDNDYRNIVFLDNQMRFTWLAY